MQAYTQKEKSRSKEQKFKDILGVIKCEATCTDLAVVIIKKGTELQKNKTKSIQNTTLQCMFIKVLLRQFHCYSFDQLSD